MEGRVMADQKCSGDHTQHMCFLAAEKQIQLVKRLTTEPQYICLDCGRVANSEDNLCKPAHVDAIGLDER
jgi:hypothetical protein